MTPLPSDESPPATASRRHAVFALLALAGIADDAAAQMGGGPGGGGMGGGGMGGHGPDDSHAKPSCDSHPAEAGPPRDLVASFAARLRDSGGALAIAPGQQAAWREFTSLLAEVGQHNDRRLQRILTGSAGAVSAAAPLAAFIDSEVAEGQDRQQALQDLEAAFSRLQSVLDERQRATLSSLFVATRADLQASRAR